MALTKQIEIKGVVDCTYLYIGLFDSNGNAYNFSPTRDSDFCSYCVPPSAQANACAIPKPYCLPKHEIHPWNISPPMVFYEN